jgi:hypothetical protein
MQSARDTRRWPNVGMIPMLLEYSQEALSAVNGYGLDTVGTGLEEVCNEDHTAYLSATVDQVPGALEYALVHPELSAHIYERLAAAGVELDMLVDQFDHSVDVSLNKLCSIVGALERATTKS